VLRAWGRGVGRAVLLSSKLRFEGVHAHEQLLHLRVDSIEALLDRRIIIR
jgi:hypothetical protein